MYRSRRRLPDHMLTASAVLPGPPQAAIIPHAQTLVSHGLMRTTRAILDDDENDSEVLITTESANPRMRELTMPAQPSKPANAKGASKTANTGTAAVNRKSRPAKQTGATFHDYGGVENLVASPTIIKLKDGSYIEIRCDRCGGNTSWAHETFISGVRGLQSHLRQVHRDQPKLDVLLQRCKYRDVSAEEVEKLITGELKIDSVSCQTTANVGLGMEYVGNLSAGRKAKAEGDIDELAKDNDAAADVADVAASDEESPVKKTKQKRGGKEPKAEHLDNCEVVVQPPGETSDVGFIELRCDVCHGNGSYGSGKLLKGVRAFVMHFRLIHKEVVSAEDVLRRCRYRDVSPGEVREIRAGNVSVGFVRCAGSARVRPKTSYKNFDNSQRT